MKIYNEEYYIKIYNGERYMELILILNIFAKNNNHILPKYLIQINSHTGLKWSILACDKKSLYLKSHVLFYRKENCVTLSDFCKHCKHLLYGF